MRPTRNTSSFGAFGRQYIKEAEVWHGKVDLIFLINITAIRIQFQNQTREAKLHTFAANNTTTVLATL